MSANDWRICPKCVGASKDEIQRQEIACAEALAIGSAKEYKEKEDSLTERRNVLTQITAPGAETYREDYEFYLDGTDLVWEYRGCCDRCGFSHKTAGRHKEGE